MVSPGFGFLYKTDSENKQVMRNGDVNNHIAEHQQLTNHTIDWNSAKCL